jgi:double-stranded uracil-DNA glycosylase
VKLSAISTQSFLRPAGLEISAPVLYFGTHTHLAPRPTRRADELTREEIRAGTLALQEKLERFRPTVVAYTGIGVYRRFRATSKVAWDVQDTAAVPGVTDVVVPSPSGLNRMNFEELVDHYRTLLPFLA